MSEENWLPKKSGISDTQWLPYFPDLPVYKTWAKVPGHLYTRKQLKDIGRELLRPEQRADALKGNPCLRTVVLLYDVTWTKPIIPRSAAHKHPENPDQLSLFNI